MPDAGLLEGQHELHRKLGDVFCVWILGDAAGY
jgi:hypothetical protein